MFQFALHSVCMIILAILIHQQNSDKKWRQRKISCFEKPFDFGYKICIEGNFKTLASELNIHFIFCGKCEFTNSCENIFIPNSYETCYADEHLVNKFRVPKKLYWSSQWTRSLATEPLASNHRRVTLTHVLKTSSLRILPIFSLLYSHCVVAFSLKLDYVTCTLRPV
jgi:hypothetical protein